MSYIPGYKPEGQEITQQEAWGEIYRVWQADLASKFPVRETKYKSTVTGPVSPRHNEVFAFELFGVPVENEMDTHYILSVLVTHNSTGRCTSIIHHFHSEVKPYQWSSQALFIEAREIASAALQGMQVADIIAATLTEATYAPEKTSHTCH